MKNTRKFMAAVMALAMVSALSPMSAFAADTEIKPGTNGTPDPSSAGFDVKYTYTISDPTFTVTIPAGVELSDSADTETAIKAKDIKNLEEKGKKIVVKLASASNDDDDDTTFHAKNGDSDATYTIKAGSNAVKVGDTVAEFKTNSTDEVSSELTFSKITLPANPVEGDYAETLTFGISVENALTVPATGISLDKTNISLYPIIDGVTTCTITSSATPAETDETLTYSWESSDTSVVTVDNNGKITTVAAGTAIITAKTTAQNGELSATCTVSVNSIATPGRGATNYLTVPGASAENPVYFTGAYTGSATTESIAYSHSTAGSYDELYFNGSRIYHGDWAVGSALEITGGSGTEADPYVLTRV